MNTNPENIPASVFDWLQTLDFAALSSAQKAEVLNHFSPQEYDDMHHAAKQLVTDRENSQTVLSEKPGNRLLDHFYAFHAQQRAVIFGIKPLVMWQAAAMVMFLLSGYLFYSLFDVLKSSKEIELATVDTVYVDRPVNVQPEIIHDTVYLPVQVQKQTAPSNTETNPVPVAETIGVQQLETRVDVMNLNGIERGANRQRRSSMKDDSLLRKFNFVSL